MFRYVDASGQPGDSPNGSARDIAGIRNAAGNVMGMMPHPERCVESVLGTADGARIFRSALAHLGAEVDGVAA